MDYFINNIHILDVNSYRSKYFISEFSNVSDSDLESFISNLLESHPSYQANYTTAMETIYSIVFNQELLVLDSKLVNILLDTESSNNLMSNIKKLKIARIRTVRCRIYKELEDEPLINIDNI